MNMSFEDELVHCFLDEAIDSLEEWECACLELERAPDKESLDKLFRSAHNLKGASRAVGLEEFGSCVHVIEDVINLLRANELEIAPEVLDFLLQAQSFLTGWVEQLRDDTSFVPNSTEIRASAEVYLKSPGKEPSPSPVVEDTAREVSASCAEEPALLTSKAQAGEEQESPEASVDIAEDDLEAVFAAELEKYQATHSDTDAPANASECESPELEEAALTAAPTEEEIPLPAEELSAPIANLSSQKEEEKAPPEPQNSSSSRRKAEPSAGSTIRIAASKIDELIQLIGELSINQSILYQGRKEGTLQSDICKNAINQSNKITKELHTKVLTLNMQPVQSLFQRLERVARDVARSQGKQIDIVLEGAQVELEKTVLERITDPLIHILRNAVDHGVENSEERAKTDKPEVATITLSASHDVGGVCIKISEDGKGLNTEKICEKGLERGIIPPHANWTPDEINQIIFLPGFSTAEKVTDVSGRGVGMDVVTTAIEALRGSIQLKSVQGKGTTFTIMLPTTMSIIDALVVTIDKVAYAVPTFELSEIIDLSTQKIDVTGTDGRMLSLRGAVVPVESLDHYLPALEGLKQNTADTPVDNETSGEPALIVRNGEKSVAFEVDSILGQQ
jgi:two-component system chemotaxis sensor kinase CheA